MSFDTYLNKAWDEHTKNSQIVAADFMDAIELIENADQISQMARLIVHVCGEHLGRWNDGIALIEKLRKISFFQPDSESDKALIRSTATLKLASDPQFSISNLSTADQVSVMAVNAAIHSAQKNPSLAKNLLCSAVDLAQSGLDRKDPANRSLAVTGNNLACSLEEKNDRSAEETALMIFAAKTARKYWEIAGGWQQVQIAEYRLAMSYLKAGDLQNAIDHAQRCIEICDLNKAEPFDMFYGYEVLAHIEKARRNEIGYSKAVERA